MTYSFDFDEGGTIMTKEVLSAIQDAVGTQVFGIWFLIGAALVFFMQAGFAMVETGFTRAKNAGNIIMKNLMDFCIGTCVFIPLGFGILLGEADENGMCKVCGKPKKKAAFDEEETLKQKRKSPTGV